MNRLSLFFFSNLRNNESVVVVQVMESEEFMLLPVNQLVDIIASDELNVRNEEQVYSSVIQWVQHSVQERRSHLPNVSTV